MGRTYEAIDKTLHSWLSKQPMFFVGTAPNDPDGHVNVSPKGGVGVFRILNPHRVAYVDLIGSGAETVSHVQENGRIVVMFCAFDGPPKIVRLHGQGRSVAESDPEYAELVAEFPLDETLRPLARGVVVVDVARISDSCGFGVPKMDVVSERDQLLRWSEKQHAKHGDSWKAKYIAANNVTSVDGLPGYAGDEDLLEAEAVALSSQGRAL